MEIRTLRYFLTVAREGSLVRAAKVLYVTQPALSRQLKGLEDELSCKLFERESHGISLTEKGRLLKQRAEDILQMTDKTVSELSSPVDVVAGDVLIGVPGTYASRFVARAACSIKERYPGIRYRLYDGNSEDFIDPLDTGILDFALLIQPADLSKYHHLHVPGFDTWGLLVRKDNPLAEKEAITAADLIGEPLIFSEQPMVQTSVPDLFFEWFGDEFDQLTIVGTYNLTFNATLFAAEGFGSVLSLEKQLRVDEAEVLCFRPFEPRLEAGADIVWKKHRAFSPAAAAFLEALKAESARQDLPG